MARDSGPPVLRQHAAALPAETRGWGWLAAGLWPALVVGLLAALVAWLWYGSGDGRSEESGEAAARTAPLRGGEERHPQDRAEAAATAALLTSDEQVLLEAKAAALSTPRMPADDLAAEPRKELNHVQRGVVSGGPLQMDQLLPKQGAADTGEQPSDVRGRQAGELRREMGRATDEWCVMKLAGASDDACKDGIEQQPGQPTESKDLDQEEWEVVSEHLAWGEAGEHCRLEHADSKEWEEGDCPDGDLKAKRVAAVPPMFQNIHVSFRVHYITHSDVQLIAVTGDHECLGQWHSYVPLKYDKDGFWSESLSLPVDTRVEWKFILVENGKVRRWEECGNRTLVTEHEDQTVHHWWGYH